MIWLALWAEARPAPTVPDILISHIPYVLWVALLLFLVDFGMRLLNRTLHPWFREAS